MTRYEKEVTNRIVKVIEENQKYLTRKKNLPQLAKLGYIFNTLWYVGRVGYGYNGRIETGSSCENNPKYEIGDNIDYQSDRIENLVYDAWGMHDIEKKRNYDAFRNFVMNGRELTSLDRKGLVKNKTMQQWVEYLTDESYRYSNIYRNKFAVYNHLLCVIGNGYGLNEDGFVYLEASGADEDVAEYGDWENATFKRDIKDVVEEVINNPMVQPAMDVMYKINVEYEEKELQRQREIFGGLTSKEFEKTDLYKKALIAIEEETKVQSWYPISEGSIIQMVYDDHKADQSIIDAGMEICFDILKQNENPEIKKNDQYGRFKYNVSFAKAFLRKFKPKHLKYMYSEVEYALMMRIEQNEDYKHNKRRYTKEDIE